MTESLGLFVCEFFVQLTYGNIEQQEPGARPFGLIKFIGGSWMHLTYKPRKEYFVRSYILCIAIVFFNELFILGSKHQNR
jgi:hypothetical protein